MDDDDVNAAPGHLRSQSHIPDARLRGLGVLRAHNSDGKLSDLAGGGSSSGGAGGSGRRSRSSSRTRPHGGSGTGGGSSLGGGGGGTHQTQSACSSRSSSPMSSARASHSAYSAGGGVGGISAHSVQSNHSRHSSLDGMFDPDLLLDRLGFIDLDPPLPHEIRCGPLGAPGMFDGKSNNSGGLTPVNERLSEETLDDCHAFNDLFYCGVTGVGGGWGVGGVGGGGGNNIMSSTMSMPSVAHSSLSGMRSGDNMSVGSLSVGSFKGGQSRGGSLAGGSLMGDGENSVVLGTLDEEGEDESQ